MNKIIRNLGILLAVIAASGSVGAASIIGYSPGAYGSFWSVDLASGTRTLMGSGSGLSFQGFEYAPMGIPEPATISLILATLVGLLITRRRPQLKLFYLALNNISKKWTLPIRDWKAALTRFTIQFGERFTLN
jgi:hypothetical protein